MSYITTSGQKAKAPKPRTASAKAWADDVAANSAAQTAQDYEGFRVALEKAAWRNASPELIADLEAEDGENIIGAATGAHDDYCRSHPWALTAVNQGLRALSRQSRWKQRRQQFKAFEARVREELGLPEPQRGFPPKWITKDAAITANLNRRRLWYVLDVLGELIDAKWSYAACVDSPIRVGTERRVPVLTTIPKGLPRRLGISDQRGRRAVRILARAGILENSRKYHGGKTGPKIWILGYWAEPSTFPYPRPVLFLRRNQHFKTALKTLTARA